MARRCWIHQLDEQGNWGKCRQSFKASDMEEDGEIHELKGHTQLKAKGGTIG